MMIWWKLFRGKNLLIVALTQFLLQFLVVLPYLKSLDKEPVLDDLHFSLLVLVTVLIAGAGYVINDYYDIEIDSVNKPNDLIISKLVSESNALKIYGLTVFLGATLSAYLANYVGVSFWFLIYPIAVYLLFEYARFFKKMVVLGNLIVAFFSAGVAGIVLFPEAVLNTDLSDLSFKTGQMLAVFSGYIFFAFCSTMYREVVKDMEDMQGDARFGARTLPVVWGISNSKIFSLIWGFLLAIIFSVLIYILVRKGHFLVSGLGVVGVLIPLFFSFYKLYQAHQTEDFHFISQLIKVIMLGGLVFLIFLVQIF